ncbi:uncharacterized protein LOC107488024 [Arachis duranensis]|uniref:Uncharacterized protein LOC107488024 n=1 Tax=Arachis duranensis TaxID=130453 RepID=A0A6P4DCW8_ARADU|nr:uncharacterized protein LOC107488024 [Arachis duranensis]
MSGYVPPIRFENGQGAVNNYPPIHHLESAYDYQVGSTSSNFGLMAVARQYVNESHHDLVNLLTQQMTTILNPMMANHETKFECVARQVERIAQIVDYDEGDRQNMEANPRDLGIDPRDRIDHINLDGNAPHIIRRDQNVDEVLARMRVKQRGEHYQDTRIVEDILNRVGINVGFRNQPYFVFSFYVVVQMAEVPKDVKNPKIVTKFAGEVGASTTEHVARYMVELGNLTNDENLKMKLFLFLLTKNTFTWFSNLIPNLIVTWAQLKNAFHSQFYIGELNVTITDLVALKRDDRKSIDDLMICFKNARS